jgi:kynurenine formamidase
MASDSWGRWGADDELGALNLIGAREVLRAAGTVRRGQVIRLGQDLGPSTMVPHHRKEPERFMTRDGGDYAAGARRPDGFQFAEDVVSFATHTGTHIDALSHVWCDDLLYNGFSAAGTRSTTGARRCGAEKLSPIVTRGVLLDVAALQPRPLGPGAAISAADLRAAAEGGTHPEPGDVVLVRTGWLGRCAGDAGAYFAGEPGIDRGAAEWLAEAGVVAVGADNYAVEVQPSSPGTTFPVHQLLLRNHGVPLIEGLVLDELAAERVPEFLFTAAALPVVGGTAGPVCPVAVL